MRHTEATFFFLLLFVPTRWLLFALFHINVDKKVSEKIKKITSALRSGGFEFYGGHEK